MGLKTLIIFLLLTTPAWAQPWPHKPPNIGRLELKQEYWDYIKEAATTIPNLTLPHPGGMRHRIEI